MFVSKVDTWRDVAVTLQTNLHLHSLKDLSQKIYIKIRETPQSSKFGGWGGGGG